MSDRWMPAAPGDRPPDVDTPALVLDLDRFEANVARMQDAAARYGVRVRPHAKSHKCAEIARRQLAAGAVGICCQKVGEAEVFLARGIGNVLISNEVVGERKLRRLAALAGEHRGARLGVCVDDAHVAAQLGALCAAVDARLDVYVELDVGQRRCGVATPGEVVNLVRAVASCPSFVFSGLHAYAGGAQHRRGVSERQDAVASAGRLVREARDAVIAAGVSCDTVTGGGTGTYLYEAGSGVYNEIQPGSYVLMDTDYALNEHDSDAPRFEQALFVLATVMSRRDDRAVLDAGLKAFSTDSGLPAPAFDGWVMTNVSDEHAVLRRVGAGPALDLGEKVLLMPSHCDPTVNLHDWFVAVRRERVEAIWAVDARGAIF
jgi:D-serine deaminase-like pyridoxal phosphate-dependent protein